MSTPLYLDTARLGRMCRAAQAADRNFARLAGEEGCSLYFEHFLRWGHTCLPPSLRRCYPGLTFWSGISAVKHDLKTVLALPREREVLVANRSAQLVRLAARLLSLKCENLLITDLEWPAYVQALTGEYRQAERVVTTAPLRQAVLCDRMSKAELVSRLVTHYRDNNCDGLFLSAVTYQGIQLPIREVVRALGKLNRPRLVVVDGAQALNHVPLGLSAQYCDLLLAGCHKWLRAYHPLGLALCCRGESEPFIIDTCQEMLRDGQLDDPLLSFIGQLETGRMQSYCETVNLAPLFTAAAAVRAMFTSRYPKREELARQCTAVDELAEQASATGWNPLQPAEPLRTGILLLEAKDPETRLAPVERLRERFRRLGVALSAYDGGLIRTSLPSQALGSGQQRLLNTALCRCS